MLGSWKAEGYRALILAEQKSSAFFMCARHGVGLGGESPLRAVVVGTVS